MRMARIVKKSQERRADILQSARHLFTTKQYDKVSMQDIMDELAIAKGTIYHYFASKEALFEAVVEDIANENLAVLEKIVKQPGNALEKLQLLVQAGRIIDDNKELAEALHSPANAAMHIRLLAKLILKQAPLYAEVIRQGCQEAVFSTESPLECAEFILSAVQFLSDVGLYAWSEDDLARRTHAFPSLIEQLLKAPKGSFHYLT